LSDGPKNTKFRSGGSGVEELVKMDRGQLLRFVDNISLLDKIADIILVDTGAGLSENVMSFVMAADEVLLVTTPEPTSITDAYALIKMVANRDKEKKIKVIVNRADNMAEANDITNKLMLVANKFLGIALEPLGYILSDDAVIKAVKQQQPFSLSFPKSTATRLIKEISEKLIESDNSMEPSRNMGFKGFINKLVSFMKA
jgi:flagellar biosynthesis protein FlhG